MSLEFLHLRRSLLKLRLFLEQIFPTNKAKNNNAKTMTTTTTNTATLIARCITLVCFMWMLCFYVLGGTSYFKDSFSNLAGNFFDDTKGGVAIIMLVIPTLFSGTICSLLITREHDQEGSSGRIQRSGVFGGASRHLMQTCRLVLCCCGMGRGGDMNVNQLSFVLILIPSIIYTLSNIQRHIGGKQNLSTDKIMMETGNAFGMMAALFFSILFIPITKMNGGPIAKVFSRIHPISMISFHIWISRIVVIGSCIHGMLHLVRLLFYKEDGNTLYHILIPPYPQCWTVPSSLTSSDSSNNIMDDKICGVNHDEKCQCYDKFRNLTGFVAVMFMIIMGLTSLHMIRRSMYNFFYTCHVLATPIVVVATCMHYNRAILYMSASLLYYLACSFPILINEIWKFRKISRASSNVKITSIKYISAHDENESTSGSSYKMKRPCVSMTFECTHNAWETFRPGYYIHLKVPQISNLSHPFTINKVMLRTSRSNKNIKRNGNGFHDDGDDEEGTRSKEIATAVSKKYEFRVIFRVTGSFTKALATYLTSTTSASMDSLTTAMLPPVYITGFHGTSSSNLVQKVLNHDVVTIIAGGIGITPYLSLLDSMVPIFADANSNTNADGLFKDQEQYLSSSFMTKTRKIVLHWVCREYALIEYIRSEYFEPLLMSEESSTVTSFSTEEAANGRTKKIRWEDESHSRRRIQIVIHYTGGDDFPPESNNGPTANPPSGKQYSDFVEDMDIEGSKTDDGGIASIMNEPEDVAGVAFSPSRFSAGGSVFGNKFRTFTFSLIGWSGVCIVWYFYSNIQHSKAVSQRSYAPIVVCVMAMVVSWLIGLIPQRLLATQGPNDVETIGDGKSRRHDGMVWDRIQNDEVDVFDLVRDDVTNPPSSLEMTTLDSHNEDFGVVDKEEQKLGEDNLVALRKMIGRPDLHDTIIATTSGTQNPAVFCCAPEKMTSEIRRITKGIALYNESFEI